MSTEKLIQTLRNVLRAKDREEQERRDYNGFDWGYDGFWFTEASREAEEKFEAALNEVVDARVRVTLADALRELTEVACGIRKVDP